MVKNLPANAGDARDMGSIPGSGKSPAVGNGNPLQYSCLENSMDKGAWQTTVHGVRKSRTRMHKKHTVKTKVVKSKEIEKDKPCFQKEADAIFLSAEDLRTMKSIRDR